MYKAVIYTITFFYYYTVLDMYTTVVENKHDGQVFNEKLIYDLHASLYSNLSTVPCNNNADQRINP
jgi:hypothetical protein